MCNGQDIANTRLSTVWDSNESWGVFWTNTYWIIQPDNDICEELNNQKFLTNTNTTYQTGAIVKKNWDKNQCTFYLIVVELCHILLTNEVNKQRCDKCEKGEKRPRSDHHSKIGLRRVRVKHRLASHSWTLFFLYWFKSDICLVYNEPYNHTHCTPFGPLKKWPIHDPKPA